jgi:5-formyltetrahydrofolate cyclo-ligase
MGRYPSNGFFHLADNMNDYIGRWRYKPCMKHDIRATILQKRNDLSASDLARKSQRIKEQVFGLEEFRQARTILLYVSYGSEVATHEMIQECLTRGKKVAVPCTDANNRKLSLSELRRWEDLGVGTYHIQEPRVECRCEVPLTKVDLIIVPGIAFDYAGHRIGHGMGYYDRLLSENVKATKIALAFELQLVETIPAERHDVSVDIIITEERVIHMKNI